MRRTRLLIALASLAVSNARAGVGIVSLPATGIAAPVVPPAAAPWAAAFESLFDPIPSPAR